MKKCAGQDAHDQPCRGHHGALTLVQGCWRCPEHAVAVLGAARTSWAVRCPVHGLVYLTSDQYHAQLAQVGSRWRCPAAAVGGKHAEACGREAAWDDATYEAGLSENP